MAHDRPYAHFDASQRHQGDGYVQHRALPLLEAMAPYDLLVGFPDDRSIDVFFGSWMPAAASVPVAPAIIPYTTRHLANLGQEVAASVVARLSGVPAGEGGGPPSPIVLAGLLLDASGVGTPTATESDAFGASIAGDGPRYHRYFFGRVPIGPHAGDAIHLTAKGFGLGGRGVREASIRSVGAVVAAGLRKGVPPLLDAARKLEALSDTSEELKRTLRNGDFIDAELRDLLQESELVATRAIIDAIRVLHAVVGSGNLTLTTQTQVNRLALDTVEPWIGIQLALGAEIDALVAAGNR